VSLQALGGTIAIMTPFLLAATGGLFSALAGMLNIALEGLMLNSAFFSIVFTVATGNLFLGILGGVGATLLLTALFGGIALGLRANIFICGLAYGIFESLCAGYIYTGIRDILGFFLVIVMLLIRPYGLFGRVEIEKV